jgi:hypothetical protein
MKTKLYTVGAVAGLLLIALTACEPGSPGQTAENDGRMRLSVNNSYGDFGSVVIHINAMTTADLSPEVAQGYGIVRSEDQGLVNLVILRKSDDAGGDQPTTGEVTVSAANLTGQLKNVEIQEILDGDSIYYISEVSVDNRETINFDFDVRPDGSDRTLLIRFSHQFYTR